MPNKTEAPTTPMKSTKKHRWLTVVLISVTVVVAIGVVGRALQTQPTSNTNTLGTTNTTPQTSSNAITIGVEYAFPGTETAFKELGIRGIKFYPENYYKWDQMQKAADKPIDYSKLDDMVRRYQSNGMTDITVGLRYDASWAAIDGGKIFNRTNGIPKPEFMGAYEKWLTGVIERYDKDGKDDMPGLLAPIKLYEIGVEYSTYVPEPAADYQKFLARSYTVAHTAYSDVQIAHAALLLTNAFKNNPTPEQYAQAFSSGPDRTHSNLADIETVLSHPESFDVINLHSVGDPTEIDQLVAFVRYEMKKYNYSKPIVMSDTATNPYVAWGPANNCKAAVKGTVVYPATEADRCRIADYFTKLLANNKDALAYVRQIAAEDITKKVVISAANGIVRINTAFTEDFDLLKGLTNAGTGNSSWGGIVEVNRNIFTQVRTVKSKYPAFYALQQVQRHLAKYDSITRVDAGDNTIRLYQIKNGSATTYVAWYEPGTIYLPGERVPDKTIALPGLSGTVKIEGFAIAPDSTKSGTTSADASKITLSPTPVFITQ